MTEQEDRLKGFDPDQELKRLEALGVQLQEADPENMDSLVAEHMQTSEILVGVLESAFQRQGPRGPMVRLVSLLLKIARNSLIIINKTYPAPHQHEK